MNAVLLFTTRYFLALFFLLTSHYGWSLGKHNDVTDIRKVETVKISTVQTQLYDLEQRTSEIDTRQKQIQSENLSLFWNFIAAFGVLVAIFSMLIGSGIFKIRKLKDEIAEDKQIMYREISALKESYDQSLQLIAKQAELKAEKHKNKVKKLKEKAKKDQEKISTYKCDIKSKHEEILKSAQQLEVIAEKAQEQYLSNAEKIGYALAANSIKMSPEASAIEQKMANGIEAFLSDQFEIALPLFLTILYENEKEISVKKLAQLYYYISVCHFKLNNLVYASQYIILAIRKRQSSEKAWNHFGNICYRAKKFNWAKKCYYKALYLNSGSADTLNNLGATYFKEGNKKIAITYYNKAIKAKGDFPNAYINMGVAYVLIGNLEKAIICYNNAVKLDPCNIIANLNLIECLIFTNRLGEAERKIRDITDSPEFDQFLLSYFKTIISIIDSGFNCDSKIIFSDFKKAVNYKLSKSNWSFSEMTNWIDSNKSDFIPCERRVLLQQFTSDIKNWKEPKFDNLFTLF